MTDVRQAAEQVGRAGEPCEGCGGLGVAVDGPTHPYMRSSPECWQAYGELAALLHRLPADDAARHHHVDAYAVQHPGQAEQDRRQRQSVAVHLVSLCLLLEHGQPPGSAARRRGRTSATVLPRLGLPDWPYLAPPAGPAAVTAIDVLAVTRTPDGPLLARAWLETAWAAWQDHHSAVRSWAQATLEDRS